MSWFQGKKTYIVGAITVIVVGLHAIGVIDDVVYNSLVGILTALGLWALRAGVQKSGPTK